MKKRVFLLFFCCFLINNVLAQRSASVLASGDWYKFSVDNTGVYKLDANFLRKLGVNIANVNPKNIKIYGNGGQLLPERVSDLRYDGLQENAIFVSGEEDGKFDNQDYILFYAKGAHDWVVNAGAKTAYHRQNIYDDKAHYFITVSENEGKRINIAPEITGTPITTETNFNDFVFYEKENVNLLALGRDWFGENFNVESTRTFTIPFKNAVAGEQLFVKISAVAISSATSSMQTTVNNQNFPTITFNRVNSGSSSGLASKISQQTLVNSNGDEVNITMNYNNGGIPSAKAYLDYIEVVGKKQLIVEDKQFSFRNFETANINGVVEYQLQNPTNVFQLWDVTDYINPKSITNQGSTNFRFKSQGGTLKEFVVVNESDFYEPKTLATSKVVNQNLHSLKDIDYIVITNKEFSQQAQRLADHHQENSNLTTLVVNLEQIYNEFSSGSVDIVAIRDFLKHVHDASSVAKKLKYVCFFGDSSYDYKDRITGNDNIVPTFHARESFSLTSSYITDDFFTMIDEQDGTMNTNNSIDIASGRIPVNTIQEATEVVDKILSYYGKTSFGDWRNTITFVADDIDQDADKFLQSDLEQVADSVKKYKPIFNINKLYADSYKQQVSSGGERYPQVQEGITNAIEKGSLVFDYFGHGGEDGLGSERYLEIPQIQAFNNAKTLPLFITVTCEFSRFDNPLRTTGGELLFKNKNGGAVSMITTTRDVFISVGSRFNQKLAKHVFDYDRSDPNASIAQNLIKAKNEESSAQKYFIFFFGDPAMKLAIPKPNIKITKMNGVDVTQSLDTLKALSKVKFEGVVTNSADVTLTDFNGTIFTTIFDKPVQKQTLDNDNFGIVNTFESQESKLFRGKASVQNGAFSFEFVVPKDVKVAYGKGKISMYAENQQIDKAGANFDVTVGGINENAPEDNTGPEIQLFMNDESFLDGGNTNASPNLIVKLSDINGINTSLTAVDHDITAVLDGNQNEAFILNDYYETELNDFTRGKAVFKLRNLSEGLHTIKVKAWDTYNNSSEATLSFVVVSDAGLTLSYVLNYPNPFIDHTEFWFNHNKPNEPLEVQVQIFTVSGKLVKTINQQVQNQGTLSRDITWNGLDDFGNKIGKGVYIYKLKVKSTNGNFLAEKYEKLVLLR